MANDDSDGGRSATSSQQSEPTPSEAGTSISQDVSQSQLSEDRTALLDRARLFLSSPQIRHEDPSAKRRFLVEKGLNAVEVETLMRELPMQVPPVPPRTYPQPPPSKLPYMLMGVAKLFTWIAGSSALLTIIYYRFLFPRITRTALARLSLKQHQVQLLTRINESISTLKSTQAKTFEVLPAPLPTREAPEFRDIHSLDGLPTSPEDPIDIPAFTLLRCAVEELSAHGKRATKEELFGMVEDRYLWLKTEKGLEYQNLMWDTINSDSCFEEVDDGDRRVWTYQKSPPKGAEPSPDSHLMTSLLSLKSKMPQPHAQYKNPFQHTLDSLTDFTGYITTQTYQFSASSLRVPGIGMGSAPLGPQEEEIRREIRALKGLVLNRRTFAPAARSASPAFGDNYS